MQIRKQSLIATAAESAAWLPIDELAEVYVSSEDAQYPVEAALLEGSAAGWRAAAPGAQTIRIVFDRPQDLSLIHLVFEEAQRACVQEFSLQWSADHGRIFQPIVRQQFSFSPAGATRQRENYEVSLRGVLVLELHIIPDISHHPRVATLTALRLR